MQVELDVSLTDEPEAVGPAVLSEDGVPAAELGAASPRGEAFQGFGADAFQERVCFDEFKGRGHG